MPSMNYVCNTCILLVTNIDSGVRHPGFTYQINYILTVLITELLSVSVHSFLAIIFIFFGGVCEAYVPTVP